MNGNSIAPTRYCTAGRLAVEIHSNAQAMGKAAARSVAACIQGLIASKGEARVIFACAPSQDEFLAALVDPDQSGAEIDWRRVVAFHMDDYIGLTAEHPQSFRHYLREHLLSKVEIGTFNPIPAEEPDPVRICRDYERLLKEKPIDLICMGIGENGHIAFNDPPVADFDDSRLVKVVDLDHVCRQQQVNDGCFPDFDAVPAKAYSLTIPVFRNATKLSIHVKNDRKAQAVKNTIEGPVSTSCPASILQLHPNATLYLDSAAASRIGDKC